MPFDRRGGPARDRAPFLGLVSRATRAIALAFSCSLIAAAALADWLTPDARTREAELELSAAVRDTVGHADDPARLDTLGVALLRLARLPEAKTVLEHARALSPRDPTALAGLGKLALFADQLGAAESLLTGSLATERSSGATADLYATRLRKRDWALAAALATDAEDAGRLPLLQALGRREALRIVSAPELARVPWSRAYPVPLVRVKLNGESVLMALDTGARDLVLDPWAARRAGVQTFPGQIQIFWCGTRVAAQPALVSRLELGGVRVENLPASVTRLRRWSIQVNPQAEPVAGVIGLGFLRRFTPTLDYAARVLELRPHGATLTAPGAQHVPFEIWGESELTVYGSIGGGRRLALVVQSGLPECGIAGPPELFEEFGIKSGLSARAASRAGSFLMGRPWTRVTTPTVSIGTVIADRVPGWSGALDAAELWRHGVRRDAILAGGFFGRRRVTIDWEARQLVFEER